MKNFLLLILCFCTTMAFSQSVKGVVVDADSGEALIGASVSFQGTTVGTITDIDGSFVMSNDVLKDITLSYIGYKTRTISLKDKTGDVDLGMIEMTSGGVGLEEVVITGTMDIVRDRRTPVAVSTITAADIQAKGGNVEFPELMKHTPSIYVANQSGGFGDAQVYTRGFDQTNTAFLLNGQPINGMEDGKMYWSNWSGMSDVASAIQVQRGLGSSKLAISSVGGTTNIIMRSTEQQAGGSAALTYGNDNYLKGTVSYNTGLINDKFGVSVLLTHWQGDGWAEGTQGQGQNYFISAGYKVNDKHNLNFLLTGAPQWHDQNFNKDLADYFRPDGTLNVKYNNNYGYLNGEYMTERRNYYHKPVMNLNWDYEINEKSSLSTVLYGSWGRGGGTGGYGNGADFIDGGRTEDGYINYDNIVAYNATVAEGIGNASTYTGSAIRSSVNNHAWYGLVSNYETELTDNLNWSFGADLRTYHGSHYRQLSNLLGLNGFAETNYARNNELVVTDTYEADPWSSLFNNAPEGERIGYANDETIQYAGVFSQLEYTNDDLSVFVQGALSNQSHVRYELYTASEENEESEKVTNLGYNLKGGASYKVNENTIVFVNSGYYSRQPFHDNIYLNFSNQVNEVTENEKIFGLEAGYKFATEDFAVNINAYRTSWQNRTTTTTINQGDTIVNNGNEYVFVDGDGFRNLSDVNQLHQGIEIDVQQRLSDLVEIKGFLSVGNWQYEGQAVEDVYDANRNLLYSTEQANLDGVKVGAAAQTSGGLGLVLKPAKNLRFNVDYTHYSRLYSDVGFNNSAVELPAFDLFDIGASYNFFLSNGQMLTVRGNVYNVFGKKYISYSDTAIAASDDPTQNWNGVNISNDVLFGKTTTFNLQVKYSF